MAETDPKVIIEQLTKKNYDQAHMLMMRDIVILDLEGQMKKIQEEEDKGNVIDLNEARLKFATKEPPGEGNWLSKLDKGTRFLAAKKNDFEEVLYDFFVGSDPKQMPAVFLGFELNHRDGGFRFVDPVKFSRKYTMYMTIEATTDDGNPVPTGTMEGNGECEIIPSLDEKE